ncbi:MAG: HAMP domain-containing protein [Chloroflexi bacterium]|nr:HAMP domain-containing protein [Chloroflexota bacterium]
MASASGKKVPLETVGGWSRRQSLSRKLGLVVCLGFLILFAILGFLSMRAVSDSTERILRERLVIAEMAANEIDRLVARAFYELERASDFAAFDPGAADFSAEEHLLAHAYGRIGTLSLGVYFLDGSGRVILAEPSGPSAARPDFAARPEILRSLQNGERSITAPFIERNTGRMTAAVLVPIKDPHGRVVSLLGGLLDLNGPSVRGVIQQAMKLGETGHAEVVDEHGMVVVNTEAEGYLGPGEHKGFYVRLGRTRQTGVEAVPYDLGDENQNLAAASIHVMAFAPLSTVPWGVAVGGDLEETFAPVTGLRNTILVFGSLGLAVVLFATLFGTRRLVRPIEALTASAKRISAGDLDSGVQVVDTGEIGVLAQALEEMRVKLAESMRELTRWGTELEERVRSRTAENARLIEELGRLEAMSELDRLRSEFVSSVSHELKTPLGFLKGYATSALRTDVVPTQDTTREFLKIIQQESETLEELVDNLLDTARLQSGKLAVEKRPVNVRDIVRSVVDKAKAVAPERTFSLEFPAEFPEVSADGRRLGQVLNNLIDNAIKYTSQGCRIRLCGRVHDDHVIITVEDEGAGIRPEDLGRVFEPFYRVDSPLTHRERGNGLGLSICRGIVEAHGGSIWVDSTVGKGSAFIFSLPVS